MGNLRDARALVGYPLVVVLISAGLASVQPASAHQAETYVIEKRVDIPGREARNVTAHCDRGDLAISGGYRSGSDAIPGQMEPSNQRNPDGWRFVFGNPRSSRITVAYQVLCLKR